MDVFETITSRRSIRRYSDSAVEEDKLIRVLDAARLAPSANNRQEWKFVVVTDQQIRKKLAEAARNQKFVAEAPVVVACCATESDKIMTCGHPAFLIDVAIAIDHMTLAAWAMGLGTCWIGAFYEDRVKEILRIPDRIRVVELLTIGYPAEQPPARPRKQLNEIVCYDFWK